jgi:hypothetical protein
LDHGKIIGDHMTYGYEIQYECDDGYILVGGDAIRSCSSCGEWTGKMPSCAGMLCVLLVFKYLKRTHYLFN